MYYSVFWPCNYCSLPFCFCFLACVCAAPAAVGTACFCSAIFFGDCSVGMGIPASSNDFLFNWVLICDLKYITQWKYQLKFEAEFSTISKKGFECKWTREAT